MLTTLFFLLGLALLTFGADWLVKGAARLASAFGVSPLVIGLTVVAYGTSAPEMAVSAKAALAGEADIAVGNVVGSNIFNVAAILGLAAVISPVAVSRQILVTETPIMIAVSVVMVMMSRDGWISRPQGILLFIGVITYTWVTIARSRRQSAVAAAGIEAVEVESGTPPKRTAWGVVNDLLLIAAGLAMLVLGARWLVDGAVAMARWLGVSEAVIGLTIIAAGTSLPELATSVVAAVRGQRDIAVGNIVGSNIFNILSVLGLAAAISPSGVAVSHPLIAFDEPFMLAIALICLPVFYTGRSISRVEGVVFLLLYAYYVICLIADQKGWVASHAMRAALLWAVVPLAILAFGGMALRQWLRERKSPAV